MTARALAVAPLVWMVGGSLASCAMIIAAAGSSVAPEIAFGMAGPLAGAAVTWVVLERTHVFAPERVTQVMIAAFGVKMLLFGVYVALVLTALALRPAPFMASFVGYYITLHLVEAGFLKRLIANGSPSSGSRSAGH
jgi:hypothetical protein